MKKVLASMIVVWLSVGVSAQPGAFSLVSPANGAWGSATPTFQWGAATGVSVYNLFVDGVLKDSNLTATSYQLAASEALTEPNHQWYVVAVDAGGLTTKSTQTWTAMIDATPPAAFSLIGPTDGSWVATIQPNLQWSSSTDDRSGLMKYQLWIDGVLNRDNILTTNSTPVNILSAGAHTWQIKAVDSVGNVTNSAIWTVKLDIVPPAFSKDSIVRPTLVINWGPFTQYADYWAVFDSLSNPMMKHIYNGPWEGATDVILLYDSMSTTPLSTGTYVFKAYAGEATGWGSNNTGSFQISNAFSGNGTFKVVGGYNASVYFTVGINEIGMFSPSGDSFTSNNKPRFVWNTATDAGSGFQKFQFYIDSNLIQDNFTDTFFTITNPLTSGRHSWFIKALDVAGNSMPMFPMYFDIDNQPPNAFNLLTPLDSAVVNIPTPNLTWQATTDSAGGSGLSKYQLWINGIKNIDSIPISSTTTAPNAVLAEGSYSWYVKAFDKVGNVRKSTQTRTFFVDFNPPSTFTIISPAKGDTIKASRPKFVWHQSVDAGSGIKRYVLNVSGQVPDTIATADTSALFPTVLANGAYTWFVAAYDRGNNSKSSDTGNFVINLLPPSVPTLALPSNHSSSLPVLLRMKWYSSLGADTYKVQVSTDSTFNSVFAENKSGLTDTTDSIGTSLSQNMLYYWRVNATNTAATSAWSEVWNFMTIMPVPSLVTIVGPNSMAVLTVDSLVFVWSKGSPNVDKYSLEIFSDSLLTVAALVDSSITDTSRLCTGLANKTTYWFHVKAHNGSGWGAYSDTRKFSINVPTAAVLPKSFSIKAFGLGNSSKMLRYALPVQCHVSVRFYDLRGRTVGSFVNQIQGAGYYALPLPISTWATGSYILDFQAGTFVRKEKITLAR